ARRAAAHLGTDHHELTVGEPEMMQSLLDMARVLDEPLADASIVPTYLLSRFARRHVKVALGGEGGDELFAGYPTYIGDKLARAPERAAPDRLPALPAGRSADQGGPGLDGRLARGARPLPAPPAGRVRRRPARGVEAEGLHLEAGAQGGAGRPADARDRLAPQARLQHPDGALHARRARAAAAAGARSRGGRRGAAG